MKFNVKPSTNDFKEILNEEKEYVNLLRYRHRTLAEEIGYLNTEVIEVQKRVEKKSLLINKDGTEHDKNVKESFLIQTKLFQLNQEFYFLKQEIKEKIMYIEDVKEHYNKSIANDKKLSKRATFDEIEKLIKEARVILENEKNMDEKLRTQLSNLIKNYRSLDNKQRPIYFQTLQKLIEMAK